MPSSCRARTSPAWAAFPVCAHLFERHYHELLDRSPQLIGAPALWGSTLGHGRQRAQIGIIDEGVDQKHPFFDPTDTRRRLASRRATPASRPPKVIVAAPSHRPPKWSTPRCRSIPRTPSTGRTSRDRGGNHGVYAGRALSGVAPNAYIGNYKA